MGCSIVMKLLMNLSTIISTRVIATVCREQQDTLMIRTILLVLSLFAVQTSQKTPWSHLTTPTHKNETMKIS